MNVGEFSNYFSLIPSISSTIIKWAQDNSSEKYDTELNILRHQLLRCKIISCQQKTKSSIERLYELDKDEGLKNSLLNSNLTLKEMEEQDKLKGYRYFELALFLLGTRVFKGNIGIEESCRDCPERLTRLREIWEQYQSMKKNDTTSGHTGDRNAEETMTRLADIWTKYVEKDLVDLGIQFQTEKQQQEADPECMATPDFLLIDGVEVNGITYSWIEVKNAVIVPELVNPEHLDRLTKQLTKYQNQYGRGILIFTKVGFSVSLQEHLRSEGLEDILLMERIRSSTQLYPAGDTPPPCDLFEIKRNEVAKEDIFLMGQHRFRMAAVAALVDVDMINREIKRDIFQNFGIFLTCGHKENEWLESEAMKPSNRLRPDPIVTLINVMYRYWHDPPYPRQQDLVSVELFF